MKKKDIEKIISDKLKRFRGTEFEIFFSQKRLFSSEIKNGQVDHLRSSRELGIALRVLRKSRLGFSYLFGPTPASLALLTDRVVESATQADYDPMNAFSSAERLDGVDLGIFDADLSMISKKEKIERLKEMESSALCADSRIKKVRKAEYEEIENNCSIITSTGLDLEREETLVTMNLIVLAEDNNNSEMGWEFDQTRFYADIDPGRIGAGAAKRGVCMLGSRQISTRICPAVLENRAVIDLLGVWAYSFSGENVYKGKSLLKGKVNSLIASPKIQLIDDGIYPKGIGSAPFDDEGTPRKKTILIKNGKLLSFLYDGYWARKTGSESTGNSIRDNIPSTPSISTSNLYISPGSVPFHQLITNMNNGLFINELMGLHMVDPVSGEFSLGASGIWIENGEYTFPVKGVTVSGSIHDLFFSVEELGDDLRFFGKLGAPSILVKDIIISGL
ncbi:MAG TPA: TldD/PmbA family protein [Desulfatiglandales bacterium]|nr:TldD/PmbA family protein [Desulfatiglandales bacterium]